MTTQVYVVDGLNRLVGLECINCGFTAQRVDAFEYHKRFCRIPVSSIALLDWSLKKLKSRIVWSKSFRFFLGTFCIAFVSSFQRSLWWRGANCISGAQNEVVQHELPRCESDIRTLTLISLNSGTNIVSPGWKDQHIQSVKAGKHGQIEWLTRCVDPDPWKRHTVPILIKTGYHALQRC